MLGSLHTYVISFFTLMLGLLTTSFVLDIVFYLNFKPDEMTDSGQLHQEKLVAITLYIHSGIEILFDLVLLKFLISQASEIDIELPRAVPEEASILNRYSNPKSSLLINHGVG